jgi:isoleucyl-tRNA synthetase
MDKWVLHKLHEIDGIIRESLNTYDFLRMTTTIHNFCNKELSAFYFDVCKDTLYCDGKDSVKRRAVLTVLDEVFNFLSHWLSPVLCYTAEEAWLAYKGVTAEDTTESIHLRTFPVAPKEWHKPELEETWQKILSVRSVVTGALEVKRTEKMIGASLEAAPKVYVADTALAKVLKAVNLADICITSNATFADNGTGSFTIEGVAGVSVTVEKAPGEKCERCWKYTTDVGSNAAHPTVCARCAAVVQKELTSAAA